jgi:hypothetical protein
MKSLVYFDVVTNIPCVRGTLTCISLKQLALVRDIFSARKLVLTLYMELQ